MYPVSLDIKNRRCLVVGGGGVALRKVQGLVEDGALVTVISPEASTFDGEAISVVAPAFDGEVGILPRHAPFMTLLGDGSLVIRTGGGEQRFKVSGGFLQVVDDEVRVVAESVRSGDDAE